MSPEGEITGADLNVQHGGVCIGLAPNPTSNQFISPSCFALPLRQLPLYPLVKAGLITTEDIIIDAKSGKELHPCT